MLSLREAASSASAYPTVLSISSLESRHKGSKPELVLGTAQLSSAPWKGAHVCVQAEEAFEEVDWDDSKRKKGPVEVVSTGFGKCSA